MANTCVARPDARQNDFVTYVNGQLPDSGLAAGDPPPGDLSFLSVDTRIPYVVDCPGKDARKTPHCMLRWVATIDKKGPWSEAASATIGAWWQ